ncbi:unnamed protein product [Rotaria magnacalcarata]|uniref:DUF4550 domain-containing protein n=1 Tax=Rotaria magnacalcarata TaxID=392030 RepID=A0A819EHR7_9BILA|nr:unnamed protein product [Rotaria magnacalcarata]CAF3849772.1 unnamed protein product [Rotaria magnacalcarata]
MNLSAIEEASSLSSNFQKTLISNVSIDKSTTESSCPNTNHVKIRFTIALAVPADSQVSNESESPLPNTYYSGRVSDASKAQTYYRVEYSLIPGEPNVAFDIVVFRTAAKIYPDNQDSRVVLTWEDENENVWIVWNHVHKVDLSRERLLALLSHKIFVKIWDGKEYCNVRTKLDKPRIGRALQTLTAANKNGDQDNSPKHIVQSMAQNFADKWVAKPMLYKLHRKLPISIPPPTTFLQKKIDYTENPRLATPSVPNVLQEKSSDNSAKESSTHIEGSISTPTKNENPIIVKSSPDENEAKPNDNIKQKKGTRSHKHQDEKREKGTAQIHIPSKLIFAGFKMITSRLNDDLILPKSIQDCLVSIKIEDYELMKDTLANEFNPLSITIYDVENMPSTPISYSDLKQRCEPVHCSYQIFDQPVHRTSKKAQARHIYWNDLNVYLTNSVNDHILREFRNSPIVNIEIHDRDERESSRRCIGSVFGSENTDEVIGRVSGKTNLLKSNKDIDWHPHGCIKLDLSELWLGQTSLEYYIPVVPCHAPESGRAMSTKRTFSQENMRIQQGDFLSSGTQMKIFVKLAKSLVPPVKQPILDTRQLSAASMISPFTRIVYVFSYDNSKFLTSLETCIRTINASALGFDKHPAHIQVAALSTYKLTEVQQTSHKLNIITGFHLFDEEQHLFILEGQKEDAIDVLYKQLPRPQGKNVEILYDSSIRFNERLYVKLGLDLTHIKLCRTLRDIVSQPLIFVRDFLAKETFEALDKLHQLVLVHKLSSSARYNLFPTIEMITSLSRDFGVPLTEKEIILFSSDDRSPSASTTREKKNKHIIDSSDSNNPSKQERVPSQEEIIRPDINFLEKNIERIRLASLRNKENQKDDDSIVFVTSGPIYPYSSQRLNATENALEQMRAYLKKNHGSSSCSFHPEYQSGTFSPYSNCESPLDYLQMLRSPSDLNLIAKDKPVDRTMSDWLHHPGPRSSRQSNIHPKSPDPARLDELSKPPDEWYERSSSNHQSPSGTREPFKWINRKDDFDRWTRATPVTQQVSAHWHSPNDKNKLLSPSSTSAMIVANERMKFLRRSPQTEMSSTGRLSATQLDRLTGILKDKPVKKGLLLPKSYARKNGAQSAPLQYTRSFTSTPDRRVRSTTTVAFRKYRK